MKRTINQKFSFRGSLANDIAKKMQSSAKKTDLGEIVNEFLMSESGNLILLPGKDRLIVGRKSDVGQYPPDW